MAKILVIESYLSKQFSLSDYALNKFIEEYKQLNPNDEFIYLDLNKEQKLQTLLSANNFDSFWNEQSDKYINLIKEVDKIIITSSMINFSINPLLKNFFDNVLQANKTFKYKYDGKGTSVGLIESNKKVQLIMSQGSYKNWYEFSSFDDYLISILKFIGLENIQLLLFDGTKSHDQNSLSLEDKFKLKYDLFKKQVNEF